MPVNEGDEIPGGGGPHLTYEMLDGGIVRVNGIRVNQVDTDPEAGIQTIHFDGLGFAQAEAAATRQQVMDSLMENISGGYHHAPSMIRYDMSGGRDFGPEIIRARPGVDG